MLLLELYEQYLFASREEETPEGEEPYVWEKGKPRILTDEEEQELAELAEFMGQGVANFWRGLAQELPRRL